MLRIFRMLIIGDRNVYIVDRGEAAEEPTGSYLNPAVPNAIRSNYSYIPHATIPYSDIKTIEAI